MLRLGPDTYNLVSGTLCLSLFDIVLRSPLRCSPTQPAGFYWDLDSDLDVNSILHDFFFKNKTKRFGSSPDLFVWIF